MSPKIDVEVKEVIVWDAAFLAAVGTACVAEVVVGTACVPLIVKIGLVVATKLSTSVVALPFADAIFSWTQSTSPPFPVPVQMVSSSAENVMPAIVVTSVRAALYTDAPSATVTAFRRLG